jgi:TPR repeat protein
MDIHGNGVDKSRAKAREWWTKGAQLGNPDCQRDLAKFNLNNGKSEGEEKLE